MSEPVRNSAVPIHHPDVPPLLSVADLSRRLNCSDRHVRRLVDSGALTPIRLGRVLRFDPVVIEAWIEAGCPHARRVRT